ncbi:hypothetical protein SKAU_G00220230 [Synaphobranchus kaupii]|uniref:Uncharacterized protein n=1 Tax=Synaphobranchus kaupii TaxID=118154 RepID=A0A9Q1FB52_SYNKA|nr:hypothetical protein SKAU_G00220230 [Synaphobranchus kaupii]
MDSKRLQDPSLGTLGSDRGCEQRVNSGLLSVAKRVQMAGPLHSGPCKWRSVRLGSRLTGIFSPPARRHASAARPTALGPILCLTGRPVGLQRPCPEFSPGPCSQVSVRALVPLAQGDGAHRSGGFLSASQALFPLSTTPRSIALLCLSTQRGFVFAESAFPSPRRKL